MLKREYFDLNTNKVSTTSMTTSELFLEIKQQVAKFKTQHSYIETLIHAIILASVFPQDNRSHFNEDRYFISLSEYTPHEIDLIISLVSEDAGIEYTQLRKVYDFIIKRYTHEYYDGGVKNKRFKLPSYVEFINDLKESEDIQNIVTYAVAAVRPY